MNTRIRDFFRIPVRGSSAAIAAAVMAVSLLLLLVGPVVPAHAATTITVNSNADPGVGICDSTECTLREAIAAANPGDTVNFSHILNGSTITLGVASGPLDIGKRI